jgi:hypothetical protein
MGRAGEVHLTRNDRVPAPPGVPRAALRRIGRPLLALLVAAGCLTAVPDLAAGQYFGRNKVQYRTFDFQVLATEHFDIYYYPEEAEAARIAARLAERWYARLSAFFGHQLRGRQPVILYAVSSHFRQTNAVGGLIGEGTGGVTEALKRRIVLPMSGSLADTDHVLGHELVHAFQFDLTGADPRETEFQAPDILQFPLWFVEGMAEYLTLGPMDAQTSMWMRDAAVREKLPHIRDLGRWEYFPYRWGHAFWAYIGARYGDRTVASLIRSAANPQTDLHGLALQLGTDPDALTEAWHEAIRQATLAVVRSEEPLTSSPRRVVSEATGSGRFNVGPRVSPDGRRLAFFSERDRFSVELFLADAESGRIERKLIESAADPHFDSLEFLNSAGAWTPDGRTLLITAVRGGRPTLVFVDPDSGGVRRELRLEALDDALNPAVAPDGRTVVLSGNVGGLIDLYEVDLETGATVQLTDDPYADLEPVFTPDGASVVFVTERYSSDLATLRSGPLRLARLDRETRVVRPVPAFLAGKHLSPQVTPDGAFVTFIAEPDGVANLYRMPIGGGPIERLSSFLTGVAGITSSSPALSIAAGTGRLAFSVFEDGGHAIYTMDEDEIVGLVAPAATGFAAVLPGRSERAGDVARFLENPERGLPEAEAHDVSAPYDKGLSLDVLGQPTFTVGYGEFGGFAAGGMSAYFSDMLGDRSLGVAGQVASKLADVGGQLVYVSRRHRWNWAAAVEQTPYRLGYITLEDDVANDEILLSEVIERQTSRGGSGMAAYPFNTSTRIEVSGGARSLSFTRDRRVRVYSAETRDLISRHEIEEVTAPTVYLAEASVAVVHDASFFGATSPIYGSRYRVEVGQSVGTIDYTSLLGDWRRYYMPVRPVTVAVRGFHYGRYGRDAQHPQLIDLYGGYPELVRGYGFGSIGAGECERQGSGTECAVFRNLIGSRLAIANVEVRAPLAGLFSGEIEYGRVPVELAAFLDAGLTWTADDLPSFAGGTRTVFRSYGGAVRVNAFGLLTLEVAASRPLDRIDRGWKWQVLLRQGY